MGGAVPASPSAGDEIKNEDLLELRRKYEDGEQVWADFTQAQTEELEFALDFVHYRDDKGNTRDPGRIQPKLRQLYSTIRHEAGQIARSGIHLDVQPNDEMTAPELAELVESLIFKVIHDPMKRYADTRQRVVMMGLAARMGAYRIEFDPDLGTLGGELVLRHVDSRNLRWAPGYPDPHDEQCPWFYEVARMTPKQIAGMANWKNTGDLIGGDSNVAPGSANANVDPGQTDLSGGGRAPTLGDEAEERYITVVFFYERRKRSKRTAEKPGSFKPLDPPDQFYSCMQPDQTGCGWASDTIAEGYQPPPVLDEFGVDQTPEGQNPEGQQGACPNCCGDTMLNTSVVTEVTQSGDNRLTIFAPYEDGCTEFWSGPWPHDTRSVPYLIWTPDVHPTKPMGQSTTSINWSLQLAANLSMRLGLEHMMRAKPYVWFPDPVTDWKGEPWMFGDDQGLGVYGNGAGSLPPVNWQANGLPPSWATLDGAINNQLRADLGTNDITFSSEQSRDIPVGSMQIQEKLGEIPVQYKIERLQAAESIAFTIMFDIMRACYTEKRFIQTMGRDGIRAGIMLRASDLPAHAITVTADPMSKMPQAEEIQKMISIAKEPAFIRSFIGRAFNIPRSLLQQLDEDEKVFMQQQAAQAAQQAAIAGAAGKPGKPGAAGAGSQPPSPAPQMQ